MQVFKLIKEDKELIVDAIPKAYLAAIQNGWSYELIDMADDTTLNTIEEIN
jgi:nitrogen fixation protein